MITHATYLKFAVSAAQNYIDKTAAFKTSVSRAAFVTVRRFFMESIKNTLFSLAKAVGISGQEEAAANEAMRLLQKYMSARTDSLGNVIGKKEGSGNGILLDAHLDTIGLVVTSVHENGFLHVDKCGGADIRTLCAHDVTVHGKKDIYGVITSTPPHLMKDAGKKAPEFCDIMIDTGIDGDKIFELVSPGDRVSFSTPYREMQNGILCGAYFDNRAGISTVLRALEILEEKNYGGKIEVLFSSREEVGGSGASAAGFNSSAQECICFDVSFAKTAATPKSVTAQQSKGVMIGFSPILDYPMCRNLEKIAKEKNIDFQYEIMPDSTGTNADHIATSAGGKKTALLSLPIKNMHTGAETVSLKDIESAARLTAEYIISGGDKND